MRLKGVDQKCSTFLCLKWSRGFSETPEAEEHWERIEVDVFGETILTLHSKQEIFLR